MRDYPVDYWGVSLSAELMHVDAGRKITLDGINTAENY